VGVLGDAVVNRMQGMNLPLMNLHERVLSVLGCRYVSDVLIDAPYVITNEMISSLKIAEVVRVSQDAGNHIDPLSDADDARFQCAQVAGIFHRINVDTNFRIGNVIQRIQRNQSAFQSKFERKMKAEQEYIETVLNANS
jgi:ethanolamine-phosphate cytidylyltransferase